jgi:outer membrane autotransporter protein
VSWLPEYTATAVNLYAVPDNYATLSGLNPNQTRIGVALESLRNAGRFELDQRAALSSRATVFNGLKTKDAAGLRAAYDQLTPEKLTAQAATTFQSASLLNSSLQQRSAELRRFGPASVSLNGVTTPAPMADYQMNTVIEDGVTYHVATAKPARRVGYFAGASGALAALDGGADRLGAFTQTGAGHCGLDYALNENQAVGLVVTQSFAYTDFSADSGSARTATNRVGLFHDYHRDGVYLNSSLSAGFSSYETDRKIDFLSETARGETQGFSYGGQLAAGYDFKLGDYILGPTASLAYNHAQLNGFTETGSAAALKVGRQNAHSLVSQIGFHASRPLQWKNIGWIPEVSLGVSRQYFNPNAITAQLTAGGDTFKVKPQAGGREFIHPGVSLVAILANGRSVRLGYEASLNRDSAEHRVNLSVNAGF